MVYGILKSHGGWVTCDSAPGFGTRMDLYLPRSLEPVEERRQAGSDELIRSEISAGETVLLVDDEAAIRTLGRIILEQHGFHVLLAEDGVEAIETFRESADRVALVILDLTMPNMSGQDTFRRMREIAPGIRVLFSSGYSADHLGEVDAGVGFINKPYRPAELLEAVRSHVRRIGDGFAQPANQ
jgi:CheY-like chemotaxis protein